MTKSLESAVEELRAQIARHVEELQQNEHWREIRKLHAGLGVLEGLCGQPQTELSALLGLSNENAGPKISEWEFAGMQPLDAAKNYLRMIAPKKKAAKLDEILKGLEEGGLKGANREDLRISLARSTYEVYKIGDDLYGLLEFFPHVKRERGASKKKAANGEATETSAATEDGTEQVLAPTGTER